MMPRQIILKHGHVFVAISCALYSMMAVGVGAKDPEGVVKKELVVIKTTEDRQEALAAASEAAEKLGYPLNLRGLAENDELGLSHTQEFCADKGWGYPCLTARAWSEDGVYVSVDRNFYYTGFDKGVYIVLIASGKPGEPRLHETFTRAQEFYPTTFTRISRVTTPAVWR